MLHEVTESYIAGKNSQTSSNAYSNTREEYDAAHNAATKPSGNVWFRMVDKNGKVTVDENNYEYIDVYLQSGSKEKIIRQIIKQ
jgi:hypothetical protein